jgi:hypothetical protein
MFKAFRKFIPFAKVEEQGDGTLFVYGLVTAEKPDQEDEVCDYDSTKPFYQKLVSRYTKATSAVEGMEMSIAPLREMHQLKAVGCGKSISFDDDAKTIHMGFHIVESEACKKVRAGVLIGFSQGGDYIKQWVKGKYTWYTADPGEVSLVDSPCLEDALIQQLVEKTFTYVQTNGSTELRKFQVSGKKPAGQVSGSDGSLTRIEKLDRVRKAHAFVAGKIKKSLYDVKSMVDVLNQLRSTCGWLYDEKEWEGDESEVPDKLKEILTQLVGVFQELVQEESAELLGSLSPAGGTKAMLKPELIKKLKEVGTGTVTLTKEEMAELTSLGESVEKANKSIGDHLNNLHKMHTDHAATMTKAHGDFKDDAHGVIGKCMKVLGTSESGAGDVKGGGEKAGAVTMTKAELDAAIAKGVKEAKDKEAAAAAAPESFTKADVQKLIDEAVQKATDPTNKARLTLVPRPSEGKQPATTAADAPVNDEALSKSVGF